MILNLWELWITIGALHCKSQNIEGSDCFCRDRKDIKLVVQSEWPAVNNLRSPCWCCDKLLELNVVEWNRAWLYSVLFKVLIGLFQHSVRSGVLYYMALILLNNSRNIYWNSVSSSQVSSPREMWWGRMAFQFIRYVFISLPLLSVCLWSRSSAAVHYDPTREDHKQFEQADSEKRDKQTRDPAFVKEVRPEDPVLPEVSQDKYYDTNASSLAELFGSKKQVARAHHFETESGNIWRRLLQ